jgi:hypothetical protein
LEGDSEETKIQLLGADFSLRHKRKEELIQEFLRRITEETKFLFLTADFSAFLQHISGERRERGPADRVEGKKNRNINIFCFGITVELHVLTFVDVFSAA